MPRFRGVSRRFDSYQQLMQRRIRRILLVSSLYDAYVLEEDETLEEQLWDQYMDQRLSSAPHITKAFSVDEAVSLLHQEHFDLVLAMSNLGDDCTTDLYERTREICPEMPVALMVTDPAQVECAEAEETELVFLWQSDPSLLLALVKLYEDLLNVDADTQAGHVRVILLVEDNPGWYSSLLPVIYKVLMDLGRQLMDDSLNQQHKQLRLRSRPKILLARSYEEAVVLAARYADYLLGVITDVSFPWGGEVDDDAGFALVQGLRELVPELPICMQSAEPGRARDRALALGTSFIDKNSEHLLTDLRHFLARYLGFGKFVFRDAYGMEVGRAETVYELLDRVHHVPAEVIARHARRDDFSHWMMARGELRIADLLYARAFSSFDSPEAVRDFLVDTLRQVLREDQSDVVTEFSAQRLAYDVGFMRFGRGSMGGKARGVAFLRYLVARQRLDESFEALDVRVPSALVVCSGVFEDFLDDNELWSLALDPETSFAEIRRAFQRGTVRDDLREALTAYVAVVDQPIAVRSSSILEDSQHLPLAGLYETVMLPNAHPDPAVRLRKLLAAVKRVWASTYGADPKAYFQQTSYRIEEERMAVLVQKVSGRRHGRWFYPTFSGVAQSTNYYPVSYMRAEDGVTQLAAGLGKMVVEGGASVRFCPRYPQILPQFTTAEDWLHHSQRDLYALPMERCEGVELLPLDQVPDQAELQRISSVVDTDSGMLSESILAEGPRVVTFSKVRRRDASIPLCSFLETLLPACEEAMASPIEVELAVDLGPRGARPEVSLLQLRPMISKRRWASVEIDEDLRASAWCCTSIVQGNGVFSDLRDIVYVKRDTFDKALTQRIAQEVGRLNQALVDEGRRYVLVGFGRWGSTDPWMGIGVRWHQINGVQVLVEVGLPHFDVEPSQGTHFFQNITSLNIGCLSLPYGDERSAIDWDWLESMPVHQETGFLRHVRLEHPLEVRIDGRNSAAVLVHMASESARPADSDSR